MYVEGCHDCPVRGKKVGSRGNPKAGLVYVGESPGVEELRDGEPFIGPSGKLLWVSTPGGDSPEILTTNAMCCRIPGKADENPRLKALKHKASITCSGRLLDEIKAHPRRVIVALGNYALWALTGNYNFKISQVRGKIIPSQYATIGIIPVMHPAALLRGTGNLRQFRRDIAYAHHLANGGAPYQPIEPRYEVFGTPQAVAKAVKDLINQPLISCDVETTGFNSRTDKIIDLGLAYNPEFVYLFPAEVIPHLQRLFALSRSRWLYHNGKFDVQFLRKAGLKARVDEDTLLLSYALDEQKGVHDLETIAGDLFDAPDYKHLVRPYLGKGRTYADIPKGVLYKYRLAPDVSYTLQAFRQLREQVRADVHLEKLYTKTLIPASDLLSYVETHGLYVNQDQVNTNQEVFEGRLAELLTQIKAIGGENFNPNSTYDVAELLFDKMRLPRKRGRSTDKKVLAKLPQKPIIKLIQEHRKVAKALSTYVYAIRDASAHDGRVHATYLIHGTRTGRLSSNEPNLQNIPRAKEQRSMFMAPPGKVLMEVDLNQAELRSLAALSNDAFLCSVYNDPAGVSIHDRVAIKFWGANFTPEDKMKAKNVNFGIVYGITSTGLVEQIGGSKQEAQGFIDMWFDNAPEAHTFIKKCRSAPVRGVTLITAFGRKKRHMIVTRENLHELQNEASNFPHQSIASDITLHAAIRVRRRLIKLNAHIVNLIHDSMLIEMPNNPYVIAAVGKTVITEMQQVPRDWGITRVPFKAEAKVGTRWGYLTDDAYKAALRDSHMTA